MFFHLRIFLYSIFLYIILEVILTKTISGFLINLVFENLSLFLFLTFLFTSVIMISVIRIGKKWSMVPIPVILTVSSIGLLALIDSSTQKFIFIVIATFTYYLCLLAIYRLSLYFKDQTAKGILAACAVASIFFFYSSVYGAYYNFTVPLWIIMVAFFLVSTMVSFQYFTLLEKSPKKNFTYALIMGLSMTEIAWVMSFWPFGYLTTGVIMLIFYYVLWDLVCNHFMNTLSKRNVINNSLFFGVLVTVVLLSSKWLPVI